MRDRLGVTDNISIKIIRGEPELFYINKPITYGLIIPKDFDIPYIRHDDYIEFHILAHSEDEAIDILHKALA